MVAEDEIEALNAWLAKAGLRGEAEATLVNGFCERAVAAGVPISRALLLVDTLHPIYEGRLVRWGYDLSEPAVRDYGRTHLPEGTADRHLLAEQSELVARWRASPFFRMLQTGESWLRRRVTTESEAEFPVLQDYRAAGMTDYLAIQAPDQRMFAEIGKGLLQGAEEAGISIPGGEISQISEMLRGTHEGRRQSSGKERGESSRQKGRQEIASRPRKEARLAVPGGLFCWRRRDTQVQP